MMPPASPCPPFSLGLGAALDAVLGLGTLQQLYETLPPGDFVVRALQRLDVEVESTGVDHVPERGPALVVANHPTGALDGLALLAALRARRADVRVLGNHLLTRIPEMREWTIPVDPYRAGARLTTLGLRAARRWVDGGGVLVVFPAGAVSRARRAQTAEDEPWHAGVTSLAKWTQAPVVPACLSGRPSLWLRVLGRLHPAVGTALLPRELLRQRGSRVRIRFGPAVSSDRLAEWPASARLPYLRARVMALESAVPPRRAMVPLAPAVIPSLVGREINGLPSECRLGANHHLAVYCASAEQIPHALREIGRLRERTFRAVGEGTGR
ncbi:MAG: 1-acyl-sn-glycerol-3-phosphate acyltransferase, partial [Acidobacteriota bacterium]|nr:1-acyl-sn-glycerol-3-phosphate acyltransferase [Acidobacteriota bacterium]